MPEAGPDLQVGASPAAPLALALLLLAACDPRRPRSSEPTAPPPPSASQAASAEAPALPPLPPPPAGPLLIEAEDFTPQGPGWAPGVWGENYFAASFANTFLSRKAFLGAPPTAAGAEASRTVTIPAAGRYLALARYEHPYRFEARFRLRIQQGGATRLDRVYGSPEARKIWAFRTAPTAEKVWDWGATENIVWEGHESAVDLDAGPATLTLVAEAPASPRAARRNVDALLLTTDTADVEARIAKEKYLPLDGLLTQAGDLYLQAEALDAPVKLAVGAGIEHSPYWVHQRSWKPLKLDLTPGEPTGWIEVGSLLDTLNDGQWRIKGVAPKKKDPVHYRLTFAVPGAAGPEVIARFESKKADLELWYDASTRKSRQLRSTDAALLDLLPALRAQQVTGRAPSQTLIFATTFKARPDDEPYQAARDEFLKLVGITAPIDKTAPQPPSPPRRGYIDLRNKSPEALDEACKKLQAEGAADRIAVVSMGDEIALSAPKKDADELFRAFLKARKIRPADVDPASRGDLKNLRYAPPAAPADNPRLHYYTSLFRSAYGVDELRTRTDVVRRCMPHALVGANFSPHHGVAYLGSTSQWITPFRQNVLNLPWGEDYVWQVPVGSPQVNSLAIDTFRSGIRKNPDARIQYYVMAHSPGTTPRAWRRQLFADIAHGVTLFNLFEFVPLVASSTENYVNRPEMYAAVRAALHELGSFEDLLQAARPRPSTAALWRSEAADIWNDARPPFGPEARSLYLALRHRQIPLDVVTDEDALDGSLDAYKVVFLADRHVSRAAAQALTRWVERGGTLIATAGAGLRDELDQPGEAMARLLGVDEQGLDLDETLRLEKQDLPYARPLGRLKLDGALVDAPGARWRLRPGKDATAELSFDDGSPALVRRKAGKGEAVAVAFLPGLAYLRPAIPELPVDRAPRDDAMAHLLPTAGSAPVGDLLARLASPVDRFVVASPTLVEVTLLEAASGWILPLVDWTGAAATEVRVTLPPGRFRKATLASGRPVRLEEQAGSLLATLRLETADAIVLR